MRYVSTLLYFLFATIFTLAQEEIIVLETPTGNIEGTLLVPSKENVPLVLIIAGSGPTDRDGNSGSLKNNSLKMLAQGLYDNNIASFRFDKRGIAKSAKAMTSEEDLRFEHYIQDVQQWHSLLKDDSRFSSFIILGHSEGSLIGMIASQTVIPDKFISLAGPGVSMQATIRRQLVDQPPYVLSMSLPIIEELEKGKTVDSVPPLINSLFRPSVQPYLISSFKYDPAVEISKVKSSILIVQGTTDIQIQVEDAKKLAAANSNSELVIIEGMNHILKEADANRFLNMRTYGDPNLELKQGLIESITSFIVD
ncbi:MAG TPA: alpha/beta hydrolase [Flavobacteriaceae bacterium]|nr:alpha/beta hydrolase [Flavobacteriaceae bacterium]